MNTTGVCKKRFYDVMLIRQQSVEQLLIKQQTLDSNIVRKFF